MKTRVEVRSQAEFDACIKASNIAVVIDCSVVARGNSSVVAWGNSSVEARENSSVEARENSSVVAWGNVFVRWFSALKIKASFTVIIGKMGDPNGTLEGGRVLDCKLPTTPAEWCNHYGVEVKDGVAILYKGVNSEFMSDHGGCYTPGTVPVAPGWDGGKRECGGGLHYSPTPQMTLEFVLSATKWVACPVALSDMRSPHQGDKYPNKIKARGGCAPVWEVTRKGKLIKATGETK